MRRLLRASTVLLALLGAAALAGDLEPREYPRHRFAVSIPASWVEAPHESGVRWEVPGTAFAAEMQLFEPRRRLEDVEKNLRARAEAERWTFVDPPRRTEVDGRPALYLIADVPKEKAARELFLVVDAPDATYLLHCGDEPKAFDRALLDRVVASFRRQAGAAAPALERFGCASCGRVWPESYRFCGDCGARTGPLPQPAPDAKRHGCAACRRDWPEAQKFCGECGARNGPL